MTRVLFFCVCFLYGNYLFAWTIGNKLKVLGPAVHLTYFQTPNNQMREVVASLYVGRLASLNCEYVKIYQLGKEKIRSGDQYLIDGRSLQEVIGFQYDCARILYTTKKGAVIEEFLLFHDAVNYTSTYPEKALVQLSKNNSTLLKDMEIALIRV